MKKIKQDSILRIYRLVAENDFSTIEYYKNPNQFNFNLLESEFEYDSSFEIENVELINNRMLLLLDENEKSEFKIAKIFWEKTNHLTPFQASDIGFWNYLNHFPFYNFLHKRWKISGPNDILNHFLLKSSSQATLIDRTLSSYWWTFYLTVDENRVNPFELTEVLFQNASFRTKNFGSYKIFRHKEAVIGTIEFIIENNLNKSNFEDNTRAISVFLNKLGGTKPLGYFDRKWFKEKLKINFDDDIENYGRLFDRDDKEIFIQNKSKNENSKKSSNHKSIIDYIQDEINEPSNNQEDKYSDEIVFFNLFFDNSCIIQRFINKDAIRTIKINLQHYNGFLLQCYDNGHVNKVFLDKYMDTHYKYGQNPKANLLHFDWIEDECILGIKIYRDGAIYFKAHYTESICRDGSKKILHLQGNKLIYEDNQTLTYHILPISILPSISRLVFTSFTAKGVIMTNKYYAYEWEILKKYLE